MLTVKWRTASSQVGVNAQDAGGRLPQGPSGRRWLGPPSGRRRGAGYSSSTARSPLRFSKGVEP